MDVDSDNGDSDHGGFRLGAGRKRKIRSSSIDIMINARRQRAARRQEADQLRRWIDDIKNILYFFLAYFLLTFS
jgi:hypothetical protein